MPKDRDQMTPEDPEDWQELQLGRHQGSGGTGYDRLPGEDTAPPFHDDDPAAAVLPDAQSPGDGGDDEPASG